MPCAILLKPSLIDLISRQEFAPSEELAGGLLKKQLPRAQTLTMIELEGNAEQESEQGEDKISA